MFPPRIFCIEHTEYTPQFIHYYYYYQYFLMHSLFISRLIVLFLVHFHHSFYFPIDFLSVCFRFRFLIFSPFSLFNNKWLVSFNGYNNNNSSNNNKAAFMSIYSNSIGRIEYVKKGDSNSSRSTSITIIRTKIYNINNQFGLKLK